jgi:putative transposase
MGRRRWSSITYVSVSKYFMRKTPAHDQPSWIADGEIFFITICAAKRTEQPLTQNSVPTHLLDAAHHYHRLDRWWVRLFLVMPDHVHGLVAVPAEGVLRKTVASWKSYTAKTARISWQRDFFEHRPRNLAALEEKEQYILNNPVRRGLVQNEKDWPWILRQSDLINEQKS